MRIFLYVAVGLLFLGCTTLKPTVAEYRMGVKEDVVKSSAKGCAAKSLKVAQAFSTASLLSLQMEYAETGGKVFAYSQSQWQESPNSFITSQLFGSVRDFELFGSVHSFGSRVKTDLILETNIEEFMQFYAPDMNSSYVNVLISLTLIDTKTSTVIATKTFRSKVKTKTADASGGVEAYREALAEIVANKRVWLEESCR
ncbi:MAG: ABC-type transport auxiliary lipoprotein family protein [Sulfurimonas sp.]|uniref:ABC-type transport auxiliary lipoprotein family protein n=1 Tax=Sulfurimonas sp. TaxID=2022749 RepID=UPI0026223F5A|nr:ABC-type transport auxiliary lipoprotein family protein [Sulfurimonas sp.]MDD2652671.1 ABC-type transport auxiliary lipoprotein family protein [Sulfurimonas sp.]MDD3450838.1 ABC-type transport auxiliary lipoprotein family protein [Sulfurimonas sp.]